MIFSQAIRDKLLDSFRMGKYYVALVIDGKQDGPRLPCYFHVTVDENGNVKGKCDRELHFSTSMSGTAEVLFYDEETGPTDDWAFKLERMGQTVRDGSLHVSW